MHKEPRPQAEGGEGAVECPSRAPPATNVSAGSLELGQLLAIVELFATIQNLTRDKQEEIQSLSSWIHGWQLQETDSLQPSVLQFIRECVGEFLRRSKGSAPIYALVRPQIARLRLH